VGSSKRFRRRRNELLPDPLADYCQNVTGLDFDADIIHQLPPTNTTA
jgi:hypothetical protein